MLSFSQTVFNSITSLIGRSGRSTAVSRRPQSREALTSAIYPLVVNMRASAQGGARPCWGECERGKRNKDEAMSVCHTLFPT